MKTDAFDYTLPQALIAQQPATPRDTARMMVLERKEQRISHARVRDLPSFLNDGDLMVLNNTRVLPARVYGCKTTGGKVELLFTEPRGDRCWDAMMNVSRPPAPGSLLLMGRHKTPVTFLAKDEHGYARVQFENGLDVKKWLQEEGQMPLPPYIQRTSEDADLMQRDQETYQTIYAREDGAVAAPTAGLHFTDGLFKALEDRGIGRSWVTLHVGPGTFRPVKADRITDHRMHEERYQISEETAAAINAARTRGRRVVAVGSTSVRTLEGSYQKRRAVCADAGRTDIFIHPPFSLQVTDAMLTNFHLPKSSLIMMVAALAGYDFVMEAYRTAVEMKYRFYSYGDGMLIL